MLLALVAVFLVSLFLGRYPATILLSPRRLMTDPMAQRLVFNLRLPRLVMATLVGMTLAASGLVFQTIFGNPLIEPGFLGVSQGAAFGVSFAIIFLGASALTVQLFAAGFGLAGLALSYALARRIRFGGWMLRLVLAGMAVSAFFSAGLGAFKYIADPLKQLPEITFWLLGSLTSVTWPRVFIAAPIIVPSLAALYCMRWRLNLLGLDDSTAFSLGLAPARERAFVLTLAVSAVSAAVSVAGIVGWVGLIVPQAARRLWGADTRKALPAAMLLGGIFTLICDDAARALLAGEIPLGVLSSFFGAAIFAALMTRGSLPARP